MSLVLSAPLALCAEHQLSAFNCGEPVLDDWLKRRSLINHLNGASRTFVVADMHNHVLGYYALASGAIAHQQATGAVRRNMPDPVPVMVLARLAVDLRAQGLNLGGALLRDAVNRVRAVSESVGVRALVVHALHESAWQFYSHYGFQPSPVHTMTLMLRFAQGKPL